MPYPANPRDLKVSCAFGHTVAEDPTMVAWEQVSPHPSNPGDPGPVLDSVTITRGRIGDAPTTDPTRIDTAFRDTGGAFSRRNVTGPYYGRLRTNTPIRVAVDLGSGDIPMGTAYVPAWSPTWRGPGIDERVRIDAYGVLSRLSEDTGALSAVRRYCDPQISARVGRLAPRAYWPIDHGDPSAVNQAAPLVGTEPLILNRVMGEAATRWAGMELAPWLGMGLQIDGRTNLIGAPPEDSTATEAVVADVLLRSGLPAGTSASIGLYLRDAAVSSGDIYEYYVLGTYSSFGANVFLERQTGLTLTPFGAGTAQDAAKFWDGELHHLRIAAVQNGPDVDVSTYLDGQLIISGTHASATLGVPSWELFTTNSVRGIVGHAVMWAGDLADIPSAADVWAAAQGHVGETAVERIERICAEEGIPIVITPGDTATVGAQRIATPLTLLRECEAADHGVLYELRDGRLAYRPNSVRYNAPVALTLQYGTEEVPGDIADLLQMDDDRDVHNVVTVTRTNGSSVTLTREDGPVGTDEIGPTPPLAVTLNLQSDLDVRDHAGWLLRWKTVDKPRYLVVLSLRGLDPALREQIAACDIGSRIQVVGGPPEHVGPDPLDLVIEGEQQALAPDRWVVQWYCEPYAPWDVGALADDPPSEDDARLAGEPGAHLEASIGKDDTQIQIDNGGWQWAGVWLRDTGDRTESGTWGTPDVGPAWVASTRDATLSVSGGRLIVTVTAGDGTASCSVGSLQALEIQCYVRGLVPSAPPSGGGIYLAAIMRANGDEAEAGVYFDDDGSVIGFTEDEQASVDTVIPGLTTSDPVDFVAALRDDVLWLWVAPTSVGVDPFTPPLLRLPVKDPLAPGEFGILVSADASTAAPISLSFDSIEFTVPGCLSADLPYRAKLGGEEIEISQIVAESGSLQTFQVVRGLNGVRKAHAAGALIEVVRPLVLVP